MTQALTAEQAQAGAKQQIAALRVAMASFQAARLATDRASLGVSANKAHLPAEAVAGLIDQMRDASITVVAVEQYCDLLTILNGRTPSEAELSVGPSEVVLDVNYVIKGSPQVVAGLGFAAWRLTTQYAHLQSIEESIQRELGIPGVPRPSKTKPIVGAVVSLLALAGACYGCYRYGTHKTESADEATEEEIELAAPVVAPVAAPVAVPVFGGEDDDEDDEDDDEDEE